MPVVNGIGQSEYTAHKQYALDKILRHQMAICKAVFRSRDWHPPRVYHYYDIYAGCGSNDSVGCQGSPLVFLDAVTDAGIPYDAHCIELGGENASLLKSRVAPTIYVHAGDNAQVLPGLLGTLRGEWNYGTIYADPNDLPPFDLLAEASNNPNAQRIDMLVYLSATNYKRVRKVWGRDYLTDALAKINKKVWLVSAPVGRSQWAFLFGTNYDKYSDYRAIQFYRVDSPEGAAVLERLTYTTDERGEGKQPSFFTGPTPNTSSSQSSRP